MSMGSRPVKTPRGITRAWQRFAVGSAARNKASQNRKTPCFMHILHKDLASAAEEGAVIRELANRAPEGP